MKNKKDSFLFKSFPKTFYLQTLIRIQIISKSRKKICNTEKRNSARHVSYFDSSVSEEISYFRRTTNGCYIISWWIGKFLGRAGFEPAQTYCQRIYSPSPLTARASTQEESILTLWIIHDQLPFVVPYPQGKSNPRCLLEREMS